TVQVHAVQPRAAEGTVVDRVGDVGSILGYGQSRHRAPWDGGAVRAIDGGHTGIVGGVTQSVNGKRRTNAVLGFVFFAGGHEQTAFRQGQQALGLDAGGQGLQELRLAAGVDTIDVNQAGALGADEQQAAVAVARIFHV